MKIIGKILTLIGALAGLLYLAQKSISWIYENTVGKYVVFEEKIKDPTDCE